MKITIVSIILFFVACTSAQKSKAVSKKSVTTDSILPDTSRAFHVGDTVYITARDTVWARKKPDVYSARIDKYVYSDRVTVVKLDGDWVCAKDISWDSLYFKKEWLGKQSDIYVFPEDLNEFDQAKKMLKMELIDKKTYESQKLNAVNYVVLDTASVKKNGTIRLKCEFGDKVYTDSLNNDQYEDDQYYNYMGQIPVLNQYVVEASYPESSECFFVDKKTGNDTTRFVNSPYLSPDKNYIMTLSYSQSDGSILELFKVNESKISNLLTIYFIKWFPAYFKDKMFWSKDGWFYTPIMHPGFYDSGNVQYLRIAPI